MIFLLDNSDSFTQNLHHYALVSGLDCRLFREDEITIEEVERLNPDGFIFSPGPQTPAEHPLMNAIIKRYWEEKPMLGVCLGFQALGLFFGGKLEKAPVPVHGKPCLIEQLRIEDSPTNNKERTTNNYSRMFQDVSNPFVATRYHSLIIKGLEKTPFEIIATTHDGIAMAAVHKTLPLWGVQFHPEAILTVEGAQIIKNWATLLL